MKVIKFPRAEDRKKTEVSPSAVAPDAGRIYTKGVSFTCPCGNVSKIEQKNMIFRSIEFYCDSCGTPHKLSNPAFFPPKLKK